MMKKNLILFLLLLSTNAFAQGHTISDGFVVLNINGLGNAFFDTDLLTENPDFTGTVARISEGQSILLGGEVESSRTILGPDLLAADSARIYYTIDGENVESLNLPKVADAPPVDQWQQINTLSMQEIGTNLTVGIHTVQVYYTATDSNHPVAPGYTTRLPSSGFFTAQIEVTKAIIITEIACDDASDSTYSTSWTNGMNGGFGFEPWSIFAAQGSGGAAGAFIATNPPNTDLNFITDNLAWGAYANDNMGGGVQSVSAQRNFSSGSMTNGQNLSVQFEHGGISSLNGEVEIILIGTPTIPNPQGHIFTFEFVGGDTEYRFWDASIDRHDTSIPFTTDGLQFDFALKSNTTYELTVTTLNNGQASIFSGSVDSPPQAVLFKITDVEDNDVFFNNLCLTEAQEEADLLISLIAQTNGVIKIEWPSVSNRLYTLEYNLDLSSTNWNEQFPYIDLPGIGSILSTNLPAPLEPRRYYRLKAE